MSRVASLLRPRATAGLLVLSVLGLHLGCRAEDAERIPAAQSPAAEVVADAERETPSRPDRARQIARVRQLAAAEARRRGLDGTPEIQAALERIRDEGRQREEELLRDALFAAIRDGLVLSEAELRAHYQKQRVRFTERRVRLRRQRFASDAEARAADTELGGSGRLDPARSEELGPLPRPALPGEVGPEALALTKPGDRVLVTAGEGSALVELVEVLPAEPRPFEEVRAQVEKSLRTLRAQDAFRAEMKRLAGMQSEEPQYLERRRRSGRHVPRTEDSEAGGGLRERLDLESGDAREAAPVARHDGESVRQCGRADHEIVSSHSDLAPGERRTESSVRTSAHEIEGNDPDRRKQRFDHGLGASLELRDS